MIEAMNFRPEVGPGKEKNNNNIVEKREMMSPNKAIDDAIDRMFSTFSQSL